MGTLASKDTRRISFDNTFASNPALGVQKSIKNTTNALDIETIESLSTAKEDELIFPDSTKSVELPVDGELNYWANRIEHLKQEHRLINKIIETEYEKTIEKTSKLCQTPLKSDRVQKLKPCYDWRSKIVKCYEENSHQSLVCSPMVQAFKKCVTSCKMEE